MLYSLLIFFLIIVLIYSYSNYPNQFSATASAIRQVWSGSCRLSCRNRASRTINQLGRFDDQCVCGSCPCDLIENVLQRCSPVTQVYSSVASGVFAVLNSAVLLVANGIHVVQCRVSCQRQGQITLKDNSTISKDVTLYKNETSSSSPSHEIKKNHLKEEIRPPSFSKLDDIKISISKDKKSKQFSYEDKLSDSKTSVEAQAGSSRGKVDDIKNVPTPEKITPKIAIQNGCFKCIEKGKMCMHECPNSKREILNAPNIYATGENKVKAEKVIRGEIEVIKRKDVDKNTVKENKTEERPKEDVAKQFNETTNKIEEVQNEVNDRRKKADNDTVKQEKVSLPKSETPSSTAAKCPKCIQNNVACLQHCPKGTNVNKNEKPLHMTSNENVETFSDISKNTIGMQTEDPDQSVGNKISCCGSKICAPGCPKTKVGQGNDLETSLDRYLNMSDEIQIPDEMKKFTKCLKGACVHNCSYPDKRKKSHEFTVEPEDGLSSTTLKPSLQGKKSEQSKKS